MGVALLALLGLLFSSLFKNAEQSRVNRSSRDGAERINTELIDTIRRDFKYRAQVKSSKKNSLEVTRWGFFEKGKPDLSYKAYYSTRCQRISSLADSDRLLYERVYKSLSPSALATANRCIESIKCDAGEFPQVSLSVKKDPRIPAYPNLSFPNFSKGSSSQMGLGTAICFRKVGSKVHLAIETLYLQNPAQAAVSVLSEETVLSGSGLDVQILPLKGD